VANVLPAGFSWLNEPQAVELDGGLVITTRPKTDFWQRTHYGFRRDDGHALLTRRAGDFALETATEFWPRAQYDQCGLMVRVDGDSWIKAAVEYEDPQLSRLGSVVTNRGFSDWATQDISSAVRAMRYRVSRRGADFLLEWSDGGAWHQMRVAHLAALEESAEVDVGVYACSPTGEGFRCRFASIDLGDSQWAT